MRQAMSEASIAIIVGSGFSNAPLEMHTLDTIQTPFGPTTSPLMSAEMGGTQVSVIARHGLDHQFAPHSVNYRANIHALCEHGVTHCIGLNVVGGIDPALTPGTLAVPHQLIDYTTGRESTFGGPDGGVVHIEFTEPFSSGVRSALEAGCQAQGIGFRRGVYGVTQGPRLETAMEIDRLERDGCTMVGMTAMPEAALAREAGIEYAILAGVVNHAAGRSPGGRSIHTEMLEVVETLMRASTNIVADAVSVLVQRA
jgi:5'-methylthioinosine phosphorylase